MRHSGGSVFLAVGLCLLAVCASCSSNPTAPVQSRRALTFSPEGLERIREQVRADIAEQKIAGAVVLLARGNDLVLFESFGQRDIETQAAMRNDSIFRIFSMTKPVTSVAVMMLHEQGHFDLDDPVARFLPELGGLDVGVEDPAGADGVTSLQRVPSERDMTIRDLLRHTSGLTYGFFDDSTVDQMYMDARVLIGAATLADTVQRLGELPLKHQPGTAWEYSISTDVLARLVEVVSGQAFDAFLRQHIFEPLGMVDTHFWVPAEKRARFASYYEQQDEGLGRVDESGWYLAQPSYFSGGGGLVSTAEDYLAFCRMILNGGVVGETRLLRQETVELMAADQLQSLSRRPDVLRVGPYQMSGSFGLGFAVRNAVTPAGATREMSWVGIGSTLFWIDRAHDLIGIYLVQRQPLDQSLGRRFHELSYEATGEHTQ